MARTFSPLSLSLPLRTTWEESWQLLQSEGGPAVDLTGYQARMFLRQFEDGEPVAGAAVTTYDSLAASPKISLTPLSGLITLKVPATDVRTLSPTNLDRTFGFEVELYIPAGVAPEYVIPLFKGYASVKSRVELLP